MGTFEIINIDEEEEELSISYRKREIFMIFFVKLLSLHNEKLLGCSCS